MLCSNVLSFLVFSCVCVAVSRLVSSCLALLVFYLLVLHFLFCLVLRCVVLSCHVCCLVLSCLVSSCVVLCCVSLSCLALFGMFCSSCLFFGLWLLWLSFMALLRLNACPPWYCLVLILSSHLSLYYCVLEDLDKAARKKAKQLQLEHEVSSLEKWPDSLQTKTKTKTRRQDKKTRPRPPRQHREDKAIQARQDKQDLDQNKTRPRPYCQHRKQNI